MSEKYQLLTVRHLAELLEVSVRHIWRLNAMGKLPGPVKLGKAVRWRATEIETWLDAGAPDRKMWSAMREE